MFPLPNSSNPLPNPLPEGEGTCSPPPWGEGLGERVGLGLYLHHLKIMRDVRHLTQHDGGRAVFFGR